MKKQFFHASLSCFILKSQTRSCVSARRGCLYAPPSISQLDPLPSSNFAPLSPPSPSASVSLTFGTTTGGVPPDRSPVRGAPWPAWWSKGCRRRPPEEERCWPGGGAKAGGGSARSCTASRCASPACCSGWSWGFARWSREQVRTPSLSPSFRLVSVFVFEGNKVFGWSLCRAGTSGWEENIRFSL